MSYVNGANENGLGINDESTFTSGSINANGSSDWSANGGGMPKFASVRAAARSKSWPETGGTWGATDIPPVGGG